MSVTPKISLIAFEGRDPSKAFVQVPDERGRWVLTDRCVVEVACSHCQAVVGEPCRRRGGWGVGTHYVRRHAWTVKSTREARRQIPVEAKPRLRVRAGGVVELPV
ncbi:hypothetical protein K32_48870 [Kaistia sp. 32K]|uniref:hypothetical protein n=1 Tax=Kaistia sp. 32K TaxID=2795690 RepID=UPI00191620C5|nr:hypothetical protein [Kaistia sp. 32K]BCP56270.1 hypothetical protein K32_48870 [Kaistia sp. 32K]